MAVRDEIKEQTGKFREMTPEQKADYIYTYYKWWILGTIAVIFFIISIVKAVIVNSKECYLYADFLNTTKENVTATCTLESEFFESVKADPDNYKSGFDYTIYLDNNYGNQQSMAGQAKIVSEYSANVLDILVGPESVMENSADVGGYGNLSEILPEGMLEELEKKGYEPYYYTEKIYDDSGEIDENGDEKYTEGDTYIGGIYIDNCHKLFGSESTCLYEKNMDERMVLSIAWNTENIEHCIEFINFLTE